MNFALFTITVGGLTFLFWLSTTFLDDESAEDVWFFTLETLYWHQNVVAIIFLPCSHNVAFGRRIPSHFCHGYVDEFVVAFISCRHRKSKNYNLVDIFEEKSAVQRYCSLFCPKMCQYIRVHILVNL